MEMYYNADLDQEADRVRLRHNLTIDAQRRQLLGKKQSGSVMSPDEHEHDPLLVPFGRTTLGKHAFNVFNLSSVSDDGNVDLQDMSSLDPDVRKELEMFRSLTSSFDIPRKSGYVVDLYFLYFSDIFLSLFSPFSLPLFCLSFALIPTYMLFCTLFCAFYFLQCLDP